MYDSKNKIEEELGFNLNWGRLDNKKASYISIINNVNIRDESTWNKSIKWQLDNASKLYNVFSNRIKKFD